MRWPFIIILLFSFSCKSLSETEKLHQTLTGKWLIIYPDHRLKNGRQKLVYSRIQDSIVALTGLKLVILSENGMFKQIDSVEKNGRWGMSADNVVFIEHGGKGFENFTSHYTGYNNGLLELTEYVEAEGEKIELVWNLKKINGGTAANLFDDTNNKWRQRPDQPESEKQMKERLSAMLHYYSDYFQLVTKESSFFVLTRLILPFSLYQHAMAMKSFDEQSFFARLFFNAQQAKQAWQYLKRVMTKLRNDFPSKKNYVEEYATFMEQMGDEMVKE